MAINQHVGICNGKVCELNAANTGLANFKYGHIDVGPELYVVNREAFFAGDRPSALRELGGGARHTEVAKGVVAPPVVNLQAFNAHGGKVE